MNTIYKLLDIAPTNNFTVLESAFDAARDAYIEKCRAKTDTLRDTEVYLELKVIYEAVNTPEKLLAYYTTFCRGTGAASRPSVSTTSAPPSTDVDKETPPENNSGLRGRE